MASGVRRSSRILNARTSTIRAASTLQSRISSSTSRTPPSAGSDRPTKRPRTEGSRSINTNETAPADTRNCEEAATAPQQPLKRRTRQQTEYHPTDFPPRVQSEWKIGPHVSAAGGVENTIVNAASIGATAFALFVKSQRKWTSPPLTSESIAMFKSRMKEFGYAPSHILPHGSYLINLGNPDSEKREKSYNCFLDDLKRCELLGLELYNFHPGSTVGQTTPEESISLIAECINRAHEATRHVIVVLENMAGAGNVIGSTFAQLGAIIRDVRNQSRVGVCLDTCHMFAAGYDIRTKDGWEEILKEFDHDIGLKYLRGMHLNDSKATLNSRKDRHENIGIGHLSLSTFAHILSDPRTRHIPLILETPAFDGPGSKLAEGMDIWKKEVEVLHRLSSGLSASSEIERWTSEVKELVDEANKQNNSKTKKVAGTRSTRGGKKRKPESDDDDGDASDDT